ncbi:MAG: hypothetical protein ACLGIK_00640 [Gemmatimonadota bacterium]
METALLDWLARTGSRAFTLSLGAFVLVNGAAIAAVVVTRDRSLVNRWTGRILAANLLLAGTGLGIPLLTTVTRLGILAVSPATSLRAPVSDKARDEVPLSGEALEPGFKR